MMDNSRNIIDIDFVTNTPIYFRNMVVNRTLASNLNHLTVSII